MIIIRGVIKTLPSDIPNILGWEVISNERDEHVEII